MGVLKSVVGRLGPVHAAFPEGVRRRPDKRRNHTATASKLSQKKGDSWKKVSSRRSFSRRNVWACVSLPSDVASSWLRLDHLLPLALLGTALGSVPVQILSASGLPQLRHLEDEKAKTDEQISKLDQEIAELRAEVDRIKADPSAVEQVARDELGMVRQTEVVFQFSR